MKHLLVLGAAFAVAAGSVATADALPTRHPAQNTTRTPDAFAGPTQVSGNTRRYNGPLRALARLGARYVGPAHESLMSIDVSTPLRNESGLKAYAAAASTPGSLYYRKFLTPSQLADAFGTPAESYAATAAYFERFGLHVRTWTPRSMMALTGSSAQLEAALHTKLGRFAFTNRMRQSVVFTAPTTAVELPVSISVSNFGRLVSFPSNHVTSLPGGPPVPAFGGRLLERARQRPDARAARACVRPYRRVQSRLYGRGHQSRHHRNWPDLA